MSLLNTETLLDFAIEAESRGEGFYRQWAKKTESEAVQKFFDLMAEEEAIHRRFFQQLKEQIEANTAEITIPTKYEEYFEIFLEVMAANEGAMGKIEKLSEALELAKKMELDALLFYTDLKSFIHANHQAIIQNIIDEERQHFVKLASLAKKLS